MNDYVHSSKNENSREMYSYRFFLHMRHGSFTQLDIYVQYHMAMRPSDRIHVP